LPKYLPVDELVHEVQRLAFPGGSNRSNGATRRPVAELAALSHREIEVLSEIRVGRTNREIASELGISPTTVNKHVHQILRKLKVRNRAQAALVASGAFQQLQSPAGTLAQTS
jgi:DNA-binding NarL/FixJ family response regulator